jgi:hypothetical protein
MPFLTNPIKTTGEICYKPENNAPKNRNQLKRPISRINPIKKPTDGLLVPINCFNNNSNVKQNQTENENPASHAKFPARTLGRQGIFCNIPHTCLQSSCLENSGKPNHFKHNAYIDRSQSGIWIAFSQTAAQRATIQQKTTDHWAGQNFNRLQYRKNIHLTQKNNRRAITSEMLQSLLPFRKETRANKNIFRNLFY